MKTELVLLLAKNPSAIRTNTPLEVLAAHMVRSLELFEQSLLDRSDHKFFHPERWNDQENAGPAATPVPRYFHPDDDDAIPGVSCPACEA